MALSEDNRFAHLKATTTTEKILIEILKNQGDINLDGVNISVDEVEELLQGINGSVETPEYILTSGAGNISAGKFTVNVRNIGNVNGTFLGVNLPPGIGLPFEAKIGNTLGAFTYDATGTTFVITTTTI